MSPSDFVIVARTHANSFSRLMVFYCELVEPRMDLENIEELGRPEIFVQPPAWLLYSFLPQIFLLWAIVEKEYMKHDAEKFMNIMS